MKTAVVIALVFVAIFAQSAQASSKDEAKKVFEELMAAIDKALTEAQTSLDKAMASVTEKSTELEAKAVAELDKVLDPLKTKLNDYIAKAEEKGFDVSSCQTYVDDFTNTPDHLVTNLMDCINQQVAKAQGYVDDALKNSKQIEEDLNSIDTEIDNCSGNVIKKTKCYAKIIEEIAKDTGSAPQHIVEDVAKATALITELLPNLETCSVNQLKKAGEDAATDVAEFAICAAL